MGVDFAACSFWLTPRYGDSSGTIFEERKVEFMLSCVIVDVVCVVKRKQDIAKPNHHPRA